ncbi:MAG: DUF6502 family protein [Pseudomonadales bacterium]|nr:DUF6502 family protein [Pseudomonadales bacterium]
MNTAIKSAITCLLRPLVRIMLRHGVSYGEFAEITREVYVASADKDFPVSGRKQSVSRIALLTGLNRKEVARLRQQEESPAGQSSYNRGVRIISGWSRDSEFQDSSGKPAALTADGPAPSFAELVKKYSGDIPVRAVLDELLRVGAVRLDTKGSIHLKNDSAYVPGNDKDAQFQILGASVADLLDNLDHNLDAEEGMTRLQLTTAYNNLSRSAVENFRSMSHEDARAFLKKMDRWLAAHDRDAGDVPSNEDESRMRAGIGIYYIEQEMEK